MGRLSRTIEGINENNGRKTMEITENNGGLSPGRLTVVVSRSLGIISVDYRGRGIINRHRESAGDYQHHGLAIKAHQLGRLDRNSISEIIGQRLVFFGVDLSE